MSPAALMGVKLLPTLKRDGGVERLVTGRSRELGGVTNEPRREYERGGETRLS